MLAAAVAVAVCGQDNHTHCFSTMSGKDSCFSSSTPVCAVCAVCLKGVLNMVEK